MSRIESTAPYNMNRLLVKISLAATSILGAVILLLWIAAIWTGDGRLGWTGALLLIPAIVAGAVMAFNMFLLVDYREDMWNNPVDGSVTGGL